MPFYTSPLDGCQLHYLSYSPNSDPRLTLIFLHGWPMSSQMYSHLFLPLLSSNIGIIALDRRGFGKSEYTGSHPMKITYDTFAADTVSLIGNLFSDKSNKLDNFVFVGASMGAGETILAYNTLEAEIQKKCKGFIWLGPSLPFPLKTESNPTAPPRELWDAILNGLRDDRYGFTKASMPGIFGVPHGVEVGEETLRAFADIVRQADVVAIERCIEIISAKDFTEDLKAISNKIGKDDGKLGMLVLHGDVDQGMPYEASSAIIKRLVPNAQVQLYEKAAHGLYLTHKDQVVKDILNFVAPFSAAA